ncbi:ROK family protein [Streptomyces sp. NPDC047525]|uniref:ROK family protein n=1 Tax=Streptomyces sp. NPDC047525 TaxID=3155264 RepID=UPI0033F3A5D9
MQTIGIRQVSGDLIAAAAERGEVLGITNGRVLAGVLMPLTTKTVEHLLDQNLTRIVQNIREGEREAAAGDSVSLDDLMNEEPRPTSRRAPERVTIRGLSGARISAAADAREALVVTHAGAAIALLIPVTLQWVEQLVDRNLSRIRYSIERGEREIAAGGHMPTLDELLEESQSASDAADVSAAPPRAPLSPPAGVLEERAIGIKIVSDDVHGVDRLVGVVTDMLARTVHGPIEMPLPDWDRGKVLAKILDLIGDLQARLIPEHEHLTGVGLGVGGHVHRGTIINSPNASWHKFPLASLIRQRLDVPVVLENDANSLAVRERFLGSVDDESMVVILITDRGVGSALVLNGQVFRGAHGMAGELGHIPVETGVRGSTTKCRCQSSGCLEAAAAPYSITRTLKSEGVKEGYETTGNGQGGVVHQTLVHAGEALGRAVATLINVFNPTTIVLYGPQPLVGMPRTFRGTEGPISPGAASVYMSAMTQAAHAHAFSTGAEECKFVVRQADDTDSAAAAAACVIQQFAPLAGKYALSPQK